MNGDGLGSPPWGPADPAPNPAPNLADTQAIPGLGSIPGPGAAGHPAGDDPAANGASNGGVGMSAGIAGVRNRGAGNGGESNGSAGNAGASSGTASDGGGTGGAREGGAGNPGAGNPGASSGGAGNGGPAAPAGAQQGPAADAKGGKGGKRRRSFWRELPVLVIIALVLALVIKAFAIQAFYIPSASMENTLDIGDRVLINKVVYHLRPIHRGDVIVFDGTGSWDFNTPAAGTNIFSKAVDELEGLVGVSHDTSIYIKRVIGLPGDHVACCTAGKVTVNGVPLTEGSYLYPGNLPSTQKFSVTVQAGRLWVMGDHRLVSYDSRGHMGDPGGGSIPESGVLGRAFVIIWPPSRWGLLNIPATFAQPQLNAATAQGGNAAAGGSSAALQAALDNGTPIRQTTSPLPLALGFVGAVPLTWFQRRLRSRRRDRRSSGTPGR
jgi:signal peptidase I